MEFLEKLGDANLILIIGIATGIGFGVFGQQSAFCLRSAAVEFWRGKSGTKLAIWLLAFSVALLGTQYLLATGSLEAGNIRQLNGIGSLSGAVIGGLMFGCGMILARGCASRLLILAATGNLRALLTGLVLTVVAQASLRGVLSPLRESLSSQWLIEGPARSLQTYLPTFSGIFLGIILLTLGIILARRTTLGAWQSISACGVGLIVVFGWWATHWHSGWAFDATVPQSVSFTGPSADTLMAFINAPAIPKTFGSGLVPGVFVGSLIAAAASGQFKLAYFDEQSGMARYIAGACLMGFGSMLAGGCAVGAGVTGGAVLATTAWVALFAMWLGAGATDWWLNRSPEFSPVSAQVAARPKHK